MLKNDCFSVSVIRYGAAPVGAAAAAAGSGMPMSHQAPAWVTLMANSLHSHREHPQLVCHGQVYLSWQMHFAIGEGLM